MHWINAAAIFIMIGSGWRIYNDDVLFGGLHFPDFLVIGKWPQYGLQWHFFGMWIFVLNGLAHLAYGISSGRFRHKLFPISPREVLATVRDALRLRLSHEDLTVYNAVQKLLYLGVILVGMLIVITGLCAYRRSVRLSVAATHRCQARLQEPQMDQGDRSHQYVSADVLEQAGRKLVRGDLMLHLTPRSVDMTAVRVIPTPSLEGKRREAYEIGPRTKAHWSCLVISSSS
jgi:hypothetical protein